MGVYLPNMEMPKPGEVIRIYNNGEARRCPVAEQKAFEVGIAVPVPPHGRLGDLDELIKKIPVVSYEIYENIRTLLENAPAIIPASEEVYATGYDTAGNYHWTGTQSGHHIIKKEEKTT